MKNFTAATAITAATAGFAVAFIGLASPAAAGPWPPKAAPAGGSAAATAGFAVAFIGLASPAAAGPWPPK
ncbi:MAG: hypothetical protein U1C74_03950, partial [Phenylobacterium sp.]|nr:hypothetical protein [Phenylobacterium sp.]